jgi:hypothetical protein
MKPFTTEEFKEHIRRIVGAPPPQKKPGVRTEEDEGFYPPPRKAKQHNKPQ